MFFFCSSCRGAEGVQATASFTEAEWIGQAEEAVLTARVYSWKKKEKKSTQCEFCSLTDFGSKSAENKAVSVQLPYVGFWSVLRFYKVALQRDTSGPSLT